MCLASCRFTVEQGSQIVKQENALREVAKGRPDLEGASKYSVPLMTTRCAGVLTPHASVLVATSTWK